MFTIDYCFDLNGFSGITKDRFKLINHGKKENIIHSDIFINIGEDDPSVNVDMTTLAETKDFQIVYYGKQEQLKVTLPESILSTEEQQRFKEKNLPRKIRCFSPT